MDRLSGFFPVKFIAYILMLLCVAATLISVIAVMVNLDNNWYSKNQKDVEHDIYDKVLNVAESKIFDNITYDYDYYLEYGSFPSAEMVYGEVNSGQFGYRIYKLQGENGKIETIKEVNPELLERENVYKKVSDYDELIKIETYLGDIENGGVPNDLYDVYCLYKKFYEYRTLETLSTIVGFFTFLGILVFLICAVGRKRDKNSSINKIPIDVFALIVFAVIVQIGYMWLYSDLFSYLNYIEALISFILLSVLATVLITSAILLFAIQVKAGKWWQSTLIYIIVMLIKRILMIFFHIFSRINLVWKTTLAVTGLCIINLIMMITAVNSYGEGSYIISIWFVGAVLVIAAVIYMALSMKRIQEGGKHLAEGDMGYQINEKGLIMDLRRHAHNLNDIGVGMSKSVEERMKSERFKTELITNVSHDIKTPLTSIINYVDFLKKEDIDNRKAREYIDVIDRQSQRLKKLLEDLVEASKAATGNINLELMPCDAGVMMTQVMGEYKEKAEGENLEMIIKLPDESIMIMADGRSMWRVLDNLLNNICKYSQAGTRVYQTLEEKDGKAVITYKNTSRYELNISGDELTERFVRGDSSRHTEGSGLGLSIARNLVELQGGTFEIYIDGDLFKVIIEFDVIY